MGFGCRRLVVGIVALCYRGRRSCRWSRIGAAGRIGVAVRIGAGCSRVVEVGIVVVGIGRSRRCCCIGMVVVGRVGSRLGAVVSFCLEAEDVVGG